MNNMDQDAAEGIMQTDIFPHLRVLSISQDTFRP